MGNETHFYRVNVTLEKEKQFRVEWLDHKGKELSSFVAGMPDDVDTKSLFKDRADALAKGVKLFDFLDGGKVLEKALKEAHRGAAPLLLYLYACKEAADWPFEFLTKEGRFLLESQIHLVRSVSKWGSAAVREPQDRPLKLLFMASSALDVEPVLDFEKEEETIFKVTGKLAIDMEVEDSGSLEGLREQLLLQAFDVVHISGHADIDERGKPFFIMEDETGHRVDVSPYQLYHEALKENPPQLLFLSGCRTGETVETEKGASVAFARQMVEEYHIPAVMGWGRSVGDDAATFATEVIYRELSRGRTVPDAVQRARNDLMNDQKALFFSGAWPLLRLFSGGASPNALVTSGQKGQPRARSMKHMFLMQSEVQVLEEGFVGRRRQLQQGVQVLKNKRDKVGLAILGTGGLGKSTLAGKISERFSKHTLIIVHGKLNAVSMRNALTDAFYAANDDKGVAIVEAEEEIVKTIAKLCNSCFRENNYLILLDDFEQNLKGYKEGRPGEVVIEAAQVLAALLHYLPFSGKETQLLITSRYEFQVNEQGRGDLVKRQLEPVRLHGFHDAERRKKARELEHLLYYPKKEVVTQLLAAGHGNPRLMEWLDKLVGQMADAEVPKLLDAVKDKQEKFIKKHVIRELLERGGEDLERFLQWMSIFRRPVGEGGVQVVAEGAGLDKWKELLNKGMALSLMEHDRARGSYRVTPLLQEELKGQLDDCDACHRAAFGYFKTVCNDMTWKKMDPIPVEELVYHALGCGEEETASDRGGDLVYYLRERLAFQESKRVGLWVLEEKKKALATADDASLLNETAGILKELGEHREAIKYYEDALRIYKMVHGDEHQDVATALNNLGAAYWQLGDQEKAIGYYEDALRIGEKHFGKEHPKNAIRLNNLGLAWYDLGEHKKAIGYYEDALRIWKKVYGEQHPQVAIGLNNLGEALRALGDPKKAIGYYEDALRIDEAVYGKEHPAVARELNNLGLAWDDLGEHKKAIGYYEDALRIDEKHFGKEHPKIATSLNNLGSAYFNLGDKKTAKSYFEQAYAIFKKFFGPEHPSSKTTAGWLEDFDEEG